MVSERLFETGSVYRASEPIPADRNDFRKNAALGARMTLGHKGAALIYDLVVINQRDRVTPLCPAMISVTPL
jgi:hypothetical protein